MWPVDLSLVGCEWPRFHRFLNLLHLSSHDDNCEYLELEASRLIMVDFNDRGVHSYMELSALFHADFSLSLPTFAPISASEPVGT